MTLREIVDRTVEWPSDALVSVLIEDLRSAASEIADLKLRLGELVSIVELSPENTPGEDLYVEIILSKDAIRGTEQ